MSNTAAINVSIVVPCYKTEDYLPRCLDSLISQTLSGIEIICVNDGSPDGCLEVMQRYQSAHPNLVRIVDKENGGLWNARWSGTDVARGEYVAFLDSDDYVAPTFAADLYHTALSEHADIVVCGFNRVSEEDGHVISTEMNEKKHTFLPSEQPGDLVGINSAAWNKLYRRSLLLKMHRLANPPSILEDVTLNQLAYLACTRAVAFTGTAPHNYMIREGSMINTITLEQVESVKRAMLEVRRCFIAERASEQMLASLDATTFLHLGVSMSFRLSCTKGIDVASAIKNNTRYLDDNFPTWRRSPYISAAYARNHGSAYLKLFIAQIMFKLHLMKPFLAAYRFAIDALGIDIKW